MTETTLNLEMPLIAEGVVKGHVTANEALWLLDWAVTGRLRSSVATNTPPGTPVEGEGSVIGGSPSGDFTGFTTGDIHVYRDGVWTVGFTPQTGQRFYDRTTFELMGYDTSWGFHPVQDRWTTSAGAVATEHWTGRYYGAPAQWTRIFSKVVDFGALPNATQKSVVHSITSLDMTKPITAQTCSSKATDHFILPVNTPGADAAGPLVSTTHVSITSNLNLTSYTATKVRLCYCRTA